MSYAGAADTGPCEGRQASPSNPTGAGKARTKEPLTETFVFRCTAAEKAQLRAKAEAAGLPAATLLREALGLTEARRRKPIPRVDPALVLAVGRIGGNLNQIARWINGASNLAARAHRRAQGRAPLADHRAPACADHRASTPMANDHIVLPQRHGRRRGPRWLPRRARRFWPMTTTAT